MDQKVASNASTPVADAAATRVGGQPTHAFTDAWAYWSDAWQRQVLFLDAMRQRSEVAFDHKARGKPPVLAFRYKWVIDGRTLDDPVNYALVQILPPPEAPTDDVKRPFVVFDPRAGHGPGIGGFKADSQIGVALAAGHPTYFVMFFADPMPGQRLEDVIRAEALFLKTVCERHPDANGKPFVIGNCQAGWALMMTSAVSPEHVGPLLLAGAPVSYWAGEKGKNPMRYSGGLLGGSWMASLASDLGAGKFDGAYLVQNFESLNPANSLWSKPYSVYANIDRDTERFLEFERWWGGHYYMNKDEMRFIINNLFVGNKLATGEVTSEDGSIAIDLRNIRSPIIVFASWGDNITPPPQALNWILDLYDDLEELKGFRQTIVYCLHKEIGHLGIFVSSKVARKETANIVDVLDLVDFAPPGLYELVLVARDEARDADVILDSHFVRLEPRTFDDLRALDSDARDDERAFRVVKRISEINEGLYETFLGPFVRGFATEQSAQAIREAQPSRVLRWMYSERNPTMRPVAALADAVRGQRAAVDDDNPFRRAEAVGAQVIEQSLDLYRDIRDRWAEAAFYAIYGNPVAEAMVGLHEMQEKRAPRIPQAVWSRYLELEQEATEVRMDNGDFVDALIRSLLYAAGGSLDERAFRTLESVRSGIPGAADMSIGELRVRARRQARALALDEDRALAGLARIVREPAGRAELARIVRSVEQARDPDSEIQRRVQRIEQVLLQESDVRERTVRASGRAASAQSGRAAALLSGVEVEVAGEASDSVIDAATSRKTVERA
jgi:hypothetical protein